MLKNGAEKETLETLITQVNELLDEVRKEQKNMGKVIEENHKINMQKFAKLIEYNEILDMTNTVFERRVASIEEVLDEVFKSERTNANTHSFRNIILPNMNMNITKEKKNC